MELRWAQNEEDIQSASFLHAIGWKEGFRGIFSAGVLAQISNDFFVDSMRRSLQTQRAHIAILSHGGKGLGAGSCGLSRGRDDPALGEIISFYFLPEAWGQGYAVSLMGFLLEKLRSMGCAKAHVWVLKDNARARRFYEKRGFHRTDGEKPITLGGETQLNVGYEMNL